MGWWARLFGGERTPEPDPFFAQEELDSQERARRRRELIKQVRKLEVVTRKVVNDQLAGNYQAVFKGRGMDFDEVRLYEPGDEIRFIDWNVSARMQDIYVKRFTEERELTVFLLVDASASQLFGTGEKDKREAAAEMAAMIAFSAIKNNDRVGLIVFTDKVEVFVPPKKGRKHVLRVISQILDFRPEGKGTSIGEALNYFSRICKRKSVAFVISDFLDQDYERPMRIAARRHDLVPVVLTDPVEEELPDLGTVSFQDPESGEVITLDTASRKGRQRYKERAEKARQARERLLRRLKLDTVEVRTDKSPMGPLVNYFKLRAKR